MESTLEKLERDLSQVKPLTEAPASPWMAAYTLKQRN